FDVDIKKDALEAYLNEFDIKWRSTELEEKEKVAYRTASYKLLDYLYTKGIIGLNVKHQTSGKNYDFSLLDNNISILRNTQDVYTAETALLYFKQNFKASNQVIQDLIDNLAEDHITPDLIFNERLTEIIRDNTVNNVSTTKGMVQKGELIVAKSDIIDDEIYQKLESYKATYDAQTKTIGSRTLVYLGQVVLVGFILTILMSFLFLFRRDIFSDNRQLSLILIVTTGMLLSLTWALKMNIASLYYIPFCVVPIIIRILFDTRLALYLHMLVILIAGFFVANSFEFVFYQVTAGMVAIFSIKNFVKRERFLVSALFILSAYFVSFLFWNNIMQAITF
ncbi:transmembrane HD family protein, partial [bacterium]